MIYSCHDQIDNKTPTGQFMLTVTGGLSQLESDNIGVRVKSALNHKKLNNEHMGRICYGYKLSGGPGSDLVEDHDQQVVIFRIKKMRAGPRPMSYSKIADVLNEEGTKAIGKSTRWHGPTVRAIYLRSEVCTKGRDKNDPFWDKSARNAKRMEELDQPNKMVEYARNIVSNKRVIDVEDTPEVGKDGQRPEGAINVEQSLTIANLPDNKNIDPQNALAKQSAEVVKSSMRDSADEEDEYDLEEITRQNEELAKKLAEKETARLKAEREAKRKDIDSRRKTGYQRSKTQTRRTKEETSRMKLFSLLSYFQ